VSDGCSDAARYAAVSLTPDSVARPEHYTQCGIEPIEYIKGLGILEPYCVANIVKYISRYKNKNGVEDLLKARQYLDWLIEEVERRQ